MFSFVTTVTMILAEAKQSKLLFVFDIDVVSMDNSIIPNAEETINLWTKTWNSSNRTSSCQFNLVRILSSNAEEPGTMGAKPPGREIQERRKKKESYRLYGGV